MRIKQIAKRVKRALQASGELQRVIDHNQPLRGDSSLSQSDRDKASAKVALASRALNRANRTLGHALYYTADHNIPTGDNPNPKPFRDSRPKQIQRLFPATT